MTYMHVRWHLSAILQIPQTISQNAPLQFDCIFAEPRSTLVKSFRQKVQGNVDIKRAEFAPPQRSQREKSCVNHRTCRPSPLRPPARPAAVPSGHTGGAAHRPRAPRQTCRAPTQLAPAAPWRHSIRMPARRHDLPFVPDPPSPPAGDRIYQCYRSPIKSSSTYRNRRF